MTSKASTPMPIGMNRFNRPKTTAAPPPKFKERDMRGNVKSIEDIPRCTPPSNAVSHVSMQIETTTLEDGSFWHRYKEIVGSKAGEWSEWMMLDLGDRE